MTKLNGSIKLNLIEAEEIKGQELDVDTVITSNLKAVTGTITLDGDLDLDGNQILNSVAGGESGLVGNDNDNGAGGDGFIQGGSGTTDGGNATMTGGESTTSDATGASGAAQGGQETGDGGSFTTTGGVSSGGNNGATSTVGGGKDPSEGGTFTASGGANDNGATGATTSVGGGQPSGDGGDFSATGGINDNTDGATGGSLTADGANDNGTGGDSSVKGGISSSGNLGAELTTQGGQASAGGTGTLSGGDTGTGATDERGAVLTVEGGSNKGGDASLVAGATGTESTDATGASLDLEGGQIAGDGGNATLKGGATGSAASNATGGSIIAQGGQQTTDEGSAVGTGGKVDILGGNAEHDSGATGGDVNITGGRSDINNSGIAGGDVKINGGRYGGKVDITGGLGRDSGGIGSGISGGDITIRGGNEGSGTSTGDVNIQGGGSGMSVTKGNIVLENADKISMDCDDEFSITNSKGGNLTFDTTGDAVIGGKDSAFDGEDSMRVSCNYGDGTGSSLSSLNLNHTDAKLLVKTASKPSSISLESDVITLKPNENATAAGPGAIKMNQAYVEFSEVTVGGIPADTGTNKGVLFMDDADDKLKWKAGTTLYDLTEVGAGGGTVEIEKTGTNIKSSAITLGSGTLNTNTIAIGDSGTDILGTGTNNKNILIGKDNVIDSSSVNSSAICVMGSDNTVTVTNNSANSMILGNSNIIDVASLSFSSIIGTNEFGSTSAFQGTCMINCGNLGNSYGGIVMEDSILINADSSATGWTVPPTSFSKVFYVMPGMSTGGSAASLQYDTSTGQIYPLGSTIKHKKNVTDIENSEIIYDLRPVNFDWKESGQADTGFIAEEVAEIAPLYTVFDGNEPSSVKYTQLVTPIIAEMKKLRDRVISLEEEVRILKESN